MTRAAATMQKEFLEKRNGALMAAQAEARGADRRVRTTICATDLRAGGCAPPARAKRPLLAPMPSAALPPLAEEEGSGCEGSGSEAAATEVQAPREAKRSRGSTASAPRCCPD